MRAEWSTGDPQHECMIVDYVPVTAQAHAACGRRCSRWISSARSRATGYHSTTRCRLLLDDRPRHGHHHLSDGLWVRPLDVAELLGGRTYARRNRCRASRCQDPLLGDGRYRAPRRPGRCDLSPHRSGRGRDVVSGRPGRGVPWRVPGRRSWPEPAGSPARPGTGRPARSGVAGRPRPGPRHGLLTGHRAQMPGKGAGGVGGRDESTPSRRPYRARR